MGCGFSIALCWIATIQGGEPTPSTWAFPELVKLSKAAPSPWNERLAKLSSAWDEWTIAGEIHKVLPTVNQNMLWMKKGTGPWHQADLTDLGIESKKSFEEIVLRDTSEWLQDADKHDTLSWLEPILQNTVRWHVGIHERTGNAKVATQALTEQLFKVRSRRLRAVRSSPDRTFETLANEYLSGVDMGDKFAQEIRSHWLERGMGFVEKQAFEKVALALQGIETWFGHDPRAEPLRIALRFHAQRLRDEAKAMPEAEAIKRLAVAHEIWPRLEGLRDEFEQRKKLAKTVTIWVPNLPRWFSPALATTDVEKRILPLLFEGLTDVTPRGDRAMLWPSKRFLLPDGWEEFRLRRDLYWSNGEAISPTDVRHSFQLWTQADSEGRWSTEILGIRGVRVEGSRVALEFLPGQSINSPAWTVPMFPQKFGATPLTRLDDETYGKRPIGSGPFRIEADSIHEDAVVLRSNPFYERYAKATDAHVREIRFIAGVDLKSVLAKSKPNVLYDVPTKDLGTVRQQGYGKTQHLLPPRIHVLLVNHRRATFQSETLRRALALAIDRESLLDRFYREFDFKPNLPRVFGPASLFFPEERKEKTERTFHRPLSGPFPSEVWANALPPRVPDTLFQPELARTLAQRSLPEVKGKTWTLRFLQGDVRASSAMKHLIKELEKLFDGQVRIVGEELSASSFRRVISERDFDLVYSRLEYQGDRFDWRAWFDPAASALAKGGSNVVGMASHVPLENLARVLGQSQDFSVLQETQHQFHVLFLEKMPFIPLWQLHVHVASEKALPTFAPLRVFPGILEWSR